MQFKFQSATKILFGRNCLKGNKDELKKYGKRAAIVTGRSSGRASGALDDIISVMEELGISYFIYDKVENNPSPETVKDGGIKAAGFKTDFVVGIGGGSPLDAAKAIAVLAVNDIEPLELYKNVFENTPLPVITIPTTAGTGSEVTPYSILTRKDLQSKLSFGNEATYSKITFMDPRYTESMSCELTVNTALDTLSHAIEGYTSRRCTPLSDVIALETIKIFGQCLDSLLKKDISMEVRDKLLYMSMLGGMVITQTGTTIVHCMGYILTYFRGLHHGKANALLLEEYLKFNRDVLKEKIENILAAIGMMTIDEFGEAVNKLIIRGDRFSEEELSKFASIAINRKGPAFNMKSVTEEDMLEMFKKSLL